MRHDDSAATLRLRALHAASTRIEIAHHVTHVRIRHHYAYIHDRLEEHRTGILHGQLEGFTPGNFKGHRLRVDRMFLAVIHNDFDVAHRVTCKGAMRHGRRNAFFDGRQIGFGKIHTDQFIGKFKIGSGQWFDAQMHFTKLP